MPSPQAQLNGPSAATLEPPLNETLPVPASRDAMETDKETVEVDSMIERYEYFGAAAQLAQWQVIRLPRNRRSTISRRREDFIDDKGWDWAAVVTWGSCLAS